MANIETTLHMSYQADTWGLKEAVRELISNALDGETRFAHMGIGKMRLDYSAHERTVSVRNEGVTVPAKALLMGTSEAREDERCIGQFGEGLPMALLVLARLGHQVEIDNGSERWRPVIERSSMFQGEPVLVVKTRKLPIDRDAFEVKVGGVSYEQWTEIRGLFLKLDPRYDEAQTILRYGAGTGADQERILLQPQYMGKVYNKGVFVMERDDLMFGYDLRAELNRDRSIMDQYTLRSALSQLLNRAVSNNKDKFAPLLVNVMFEKDGRLEVSDDYSELFYNDDVCDFVEKFFVQKYGESALAASDSDEEDRIKKLGRTPVRTSSLVKRIVASRRGRIDDLERQAAQAVIRVWEPSELTRHELFNLEVSKTLIRAVRPAAGFNVEVVDFSGDVQFRVVKSRDDDDGDLTCTVRVGKVVLMEMKGLILALAKAVCQATDDYSVESVLADMTAKLLSGDSNLTLLLLAGNR